MTGSSRPEEPRQAPITVSDLRHSGVVGRPEVRAGPTGVSGASTLEFVLGVVRRRWLGVLLVALPVVALAAVYAYFAPRQYESSSTFLVEASGQDIGSSLELLDRIGRVRRLENEIALLQSRRVIAPTVDRLNLNVHGIVGSQEVRPETFLDGFDATAEAAPARLQAALAGDGVRLLDSETGKEIVRWLPGDTVNLPGLTFVGPSADALPFQLEVEDATRTADWLSDHIEVERVGREADLVRLTCTASTPRLAHDVCSEHSASYLELRQELQVSEAANAREFLTDAARRIKDQLSAAEDSLAQYAKRHGGVALNTRADAEVRNVADLAAQRDTKAAELTALRDFMAGVEGGADGSARYRELASFPAFLENDAVTQMVASLITLDNRKSDLSVLRSDQNPELAAVNQRIAEIEGQLQGVVQGYERALASQVNALTQTLDGVERRVAGIPETQMELVRRERQVEQLETIYGTLEGRLREAQLAEGVVITNVRPIDSPQMPLDPSSPAVGMTLAIGMSLGLALGILFAGLRELTDVRLRDRSDIEGVAGLRVIGMVPEMREPGPLLQNGHHDGGTKRLPRAAASTEELRDRGPAIEAFRTLVADLKLTIAERNGHDPLKSIAVTSSAQGEGKTFTSCNLALIWASMGVKTLLVDADLRLGVVERFFGLMKDRPGLADVLRGDVHPSIAYQRVSAGGDELLHVLTAGNTKPSDTDLFHKPGRIREAIEFFTREFDLVLVDTPPLNVVSDSTVLTASVDGVLFVVRSGWTRPDALELALHRLQRTNENLLGLVLNDVTLPSYQRSYYEYR